MLLGAPAFRWVFILGAGARPHKKEPSPRSGAAQNLWQAPGGERLKERRDRALLAVLLACGLRRHEAVELNFSHIQQREEHWAIVDLKGKAGHIRTIPMPAWVKNVLDRWLQAANITSGKLFRRVHKMGKTWGERLTEKAVWHVVREYATKAGIDKLAPHDLRRSCARLCHAAGGELEQIQFLLGHISIQNRTISWLQTAHSRCGQRQNRNRAIGLSEPLTVRFADNPRSNTICQNGQGVTFKSEK